MAGDRLDVRGVEIAIAGSHHALVVQLCPVVDRLSSNGVDDGNSVKSVTFPPLFCIKTTLPREYLDQRRQRVGTVGEHVQRDLSVATDVVGGKGIR